MDDLDKLSASEAGAQIPSLDDLPVAPGPSTSSSGMRSSGSMVGGLGPSSGFQFDLRGMARKLGRGAAWVGALFLIFLISAWVSLPTRSMAWRISHEARKAGFNITVEDVSLRPWGSATLYMVKWNFEPSRPDSMPVPFVIEELDVHFSVLSYLLFGDLDLEFEGTLDEGRISGAFSKDEDESHIAFTIEELPLYVVPKLQDSVNAPVRGLFALDIDMRAPGNKWSKSTGRLEVHCYSCTIGDGETKLYVPGSKKKSMLSKGVTIPEIDLGTLDGVLEVVEGKAVAQEFGTESDDITFKISGDITFEDPVANSRLNLLIKIFVSPSLRQRSDNIDLVVATANPNVKMDPPDEGWMGVVLEGNFKHRRFRGIKAKSRAERLREKRDARTARSKKRQVDRATARAEREAKKAKPTPKAKDAEEAASGRSEPVMMDPNRKLPAEAGIITELEPEEGEEGEEDEGGEEAGDEASDEVGEEGEGEEEGEAEEGEEGEEGEEEEAEAGVLPQ